jgi:hypothetical protein
VEVVVHQVHQVQVVLQEVQEHPDQVVHQDRVVRQVHQVLAEQVEVVVLQDLQEHRVQVVLAGLRVHLEVLVVAVPEY